jgi:hypothetical protein
MRQCACCGEYKKDDPSNFALLIRALNLNLMLICFDCIDFMWKERNPDYATKNENAETSKTDGQGSEQPA